jgi:plastocyanin
VRHRARILALASGCAVLALPLLGAVTGAATLQGHISLTPWSDDSSAAEMNPYPGMLGSMTHSGPAHDFNDVRDVVVQLPAASKASELEVARRRPKLNQLGQQFVPRVLGITVGTTVDFYNLDPVFHNVFSYSKAKRFDLGRYGKGKMRSVTFDKPGLVKVFCDIHSNMEAFIYVVESPMVVQPDDEGNFELRHVVPGSYAVKVWHPERGEKTVQVDVGEGTTRIQITL